MHRHTANQHRDLRRQIQMPFAEKRGSPFKWLETIESSPFVIRGSLAPVTHFIACSRTSIAASISARSCGGAVTRTCRDNMVRKERRTMSGWPTTLAVRCRSAGDARDLQRNGCSRWTACPRLHSSRLMSEGIAGLRSLVPFDAAWWGECSGGMDGLAPRNWLSGTHQPQRDFAREWNRIGASDRFAGESMQRLDTVVCEVGMRTRSAVELSRAVTISTMSWRSRVRWTGSGLLQLVIVVSTRASPSFEPAHRVLFEQFSAHLMQRWSARVAALVGNGGTPGEAHGLVDAKRRFRLCRRPPRARAEGGVAPVGRHRACRTLWRSPCARGLSR